MPDPGKIHPILAERMRAAAAGKELAVIVLYRSRRQGLAVDVEGVSPSTRAFRLIPAAARTATREGIERLSDNENVRMVWYDAPVHTTLDVSVPLIHAPQVWEKGQTGKGIKVGLVDTGIDANHPDLAMRIAQMKDVTGEGPLDNHGHGTHVAGIIGGSGAASQGAFRGVAWECTFYVAKVIRGDGMGSTSDVMAGLEWVVQQGAQVVNLALASDVASDGTDALAVICDAVVGKGVVVCAAAGNAGPVQGTVGSPACSQSVLTVGATDKEDQMASFSSRGPTLDGRTKPDVCFPGVNVTACRASDTSVGTPVDGYYTRASGTSMATAHATGACALLLQSHPGLSPDQVKALIKETASNLGFDANAQGTGRGDLMAAVSRAKGEAPPSRLPIPAPASAGCLGMVKGLLRGR